MSKERLQEIKRYVEHTVHLTVIGESHMNWLISEVERLQVENDELKGKLDFAKGVNQLNFDTAFKTQQRVERLEKALKEIKGNQLFSSDPEYAIKIAKQALETEGEE